MQLSPKGADLIAGFEGFARTRPGNPDLAFPYRDAVGVPTIGFGSTKGVTMSSPPITRAQAVARMQREVDATYGKAVNALKLPLNQNQFDALVSFVYNVGPGGVGPSTTVGKRLRAHDWRGAADALLAWDKAGGRVLPGLARRRASERALFLTPEKDPFDGYTASEVRWIREYDRLLRARKGADRRRVLRRVMTEQRKRLWHAAQGPGGWGTHNRAARYQSLLARTK